MTIKARVVGGKEEDLVDKRVKEKGIKREKTLKNISNREGNGFADRSDLIFTELQNDGDDMLFDGLSIKEFDDRSELL